MPKRIFFVHGRNFKPPKAKLRRLWYDAVTWGLERDFSAAKARRFGEIGKDFIYYGDISNPLLIAAYDKPSDFDTDDSTSRRATLNELKTYESNQFTKARYNKLPGKSAAGETLADLFGGVAAFFRLSDPLIGAIAPDMREYWNFDSRFGSKVRARLSRPLARSLEAGEKVMLVGHSLGTLISYDTLWKFSHYSEYGHIRSKKIDVMLTLGSPLADETVKRNLKGGRADGSRRYPWNIRNWINVAAEDDYIAHDEKVRDDYKPMRRADLVDSIKDVRIHNLAVRDHASNPHHGVGYLIHPKVIEVIGTWL